MNLFNSMHATCSGCRMASLADLAATLTTCPCHALGFPCRVGQVWKVFLIQKAGPVGEELNFEEVFTLDAKTREITKQTVANLATSDDPWDHVLRIRCCSNQRALRSRGSMRLLLLGACLHCCFGADD